MRVSPGAFGRKKLPAPSALPQQYRQLSTGKLARERRAITHLVLKYLFPVFS